MNVKQLKRSDEHSFKAIIFDIGDFKITCRAGANGCSTVDAKLRSSCSSLKNRPDDKESAAQKEIVPFDHGKSELVDFKEF